MYQTHIVMLYYDSCKNHTFTNIIDCKIFCSKQSILFFICTFATSIVETAA